MRANDRVPEGKNPSGTAGLDGAGLADLLQRSSRGDSEAFAQLYDATSARVYGVVVRVVRDPSQAAEVTQDCYLQYWEQAARYDPSKGSVQAWMTTIAHRRAVDRVRSAQAAQDRHVLYEARQARHSDDVSEVVVNRFEADRVRRALRTLTATQREAIEFAYFGGYTHVEVAGILNIPLGTAKTRLRDGLIRLRDFFGGEER
ncbi:ECF RNA polymerase sigma factor SigK [Ruania alkalisoli]|uniref:ECF RNA polymerase sigma factor SigK n=1 Tax=Ruania alkalisoli TaxID=2779775 RepID=A0A7M1ST33_9MICO|nr:ECF RNA polymerase sigma factor SigK [Ruania alkalisoli]QOR70124.1 ECF RNA polymerase sigma factor SigK [Ruania alkalisoli]